jgi:uncharacterized protein (TIGR01777 family)
MKAVLAGGTGFIGRHLAKSLETDGYEVKILARAVRSQNQVQWDGKSLGAWVNELNGADLVVNLAGKSISDKPTHENKQEMMDSRVQSTLAIGEAVLKCDEPPKVWLNSSAVGYYGDRDQETLTETSSAGEGFLAEICIAWEDAISRFQTPKTRKAWIRTGFVLGRDGGALPMMETAVKAFVGGQLGNGEQWIPWIHIDDLIALYRWIDDEGREGAFNGCNPNPEQNSEFMKTLRHVLHRPWAPPAPEWALEAVAAVAPVNPTLALVSSRVVPQRALEGGFAFRYTNLEDTLANLVAEK